MKNIFFLLIGVFTLVACSNSGEDSITFNETSLNASQKSDNIDSELEDLYVKMIQSQSYINFELEIRKFNAKLGSDIPESEMQSGATILNWVSSNISKTTFTDYNEASAQYDVILTLAQASNTENIGFVRYLAGSIEGALTPILDHMTP